MMMSVTTPFDGPRELSTSRCHMPFRVLRISVPLLRMCVPANLCPKAANLCCPYCELVSQSCEFVSRAANLCPLRELPCVNNVLNVFFRDYDTFCVTFVGVCVMMKYTTDRGGI